MNEKTLYERLGGYDGITGFVENLLPRLQADSLLGRFWENRGDDGVRPTHPNSRLDSSFRSRQSICQPRFPAGPPKTRVRVQHEWDGELLR